MRPQPPYIYSLVSDATLDLQHGEKLHTKAHSMAVRFLVMAHVDNDRLLLPRGPPSWLLEDPETRCSPIRSCTSCQPGKAFPPPLYNNPIDYRSLLTLSF